MRRNDLGKARESAKQIDEKYGGFLSDTPPLPAPTDTISSVIEANKAQCARLFNAIKDGNASTVDSIIRDDRLFTSLSYRNNQGDTLLIAAIKALDEKEESNEKVEQRFKVLMVLLNRHSAPKFRNKFFGRYVLKF